MAYLYHLIVNEKRVKTFVMKESAENYAREHNLYPYKVEEEEIPDMSLGGDDKK